MHFKALIFRTIELEEIVRDQRIVLPTARAYSEGQSSPRTVYMDRKVAMVGQANTLQPGGGLTRRMRGLLIAVFLALGKDDSLAASKFIYLSGTNSIEVVYFSGSEFLMGRPARSEVRVATFDRQAAEPEHLVHLSAFWISKYPITVEHICEYMNLQTNRELFAGENLLKRDAFRNSSGRFSPKKGRAQFPARNVPPGLAIAFCEWLSHSGRKCRLPTEAEWEYVAKGTEGRTYPWGETPQVRNLYNSPVGAHPQLATPDGIQSSLPMV